MKKPILGDLPLPKMQRGLARSLSLASTVRTNGLASLFRPPPKTRLPPKPRPLAAKKPPRG